MSNSSEVQAISQPPQQTFNFEGHEVRVFAKGGDPWFAAKDLCTALGLANSRKALRALGEDEKGVTSSYSLGGEQQLATVSEGGMWTLVLRCRDAVIEGTVPYRVRRWVTNEVLPSIRKTGQYQQGVQQRNPAIDYDRISPAQAQDLKEIVQAIVNAGIQSYGETWKRLQNKFKVNSYLQLPATSHLEARQYLVAKLPNGHHPEVLDEAPTLNLTDADRLDSAMTLALEAGAQAQRSVFNAVMAGSSDWKHGRYMLRFDTAVSNAAVARVNAIERDACVLPMERFHEAIEESFTVDAQTLARLASTCAVKLGRMAQRLNGPGPAMPT